MKRIPPRPLIFPLSLISAEVNVPFLVIIWSPAPKLRIVPLSLPLSPTRNTSLPPPRSISTDLSSVLIEPVPKTSVSLPAEALIVTFEALRSSNMVVVLAGGVTVIGVVDLTFLSVEAKTIVSSVWTAVMPAAVNWLSGMDVDEEGKLGVATSKQKTVPSDYSRSGHKLQREPLGS